MKAKHRLIVITSVLLIFLLACNISGQQNTGDNTGDNVDREDTLATAIAETVAAANQQSTLDAQQPSGDDDAGGDDTGGDDDGGQEPPAPTDTQAPPPPTNTPLPTNTPQPTPTNTPLPTPTSPAGDPAIALGSPDWTHNFNQEYPWHTYTSSSDETEITGGKYVFRFFQNISYPIWAFAAVEIEDYYLEINVQMPAVCAGKDSGGLIFGSPTGHNNEGYIYRVSCDGRYRLTSYDGSTTDILVSWSTDPAILVGPDQINRLGVMVNGDHITLYINGVKVAETDDSLYTAPGRFGVAASAPETDDLVITFDNAAYWLLP
jgi:hypothetical protein